MLFNAKKPFGKKGKEDIMLLDKRCIETLFYYFYISDETMIIRIPKYQLETLQITYILYLNRTNPQCRTLLIIYAAEALKSSYNPDN